MRTRLPRAAVARACDVLARALPTVTVTNRTSRAVSTTQSDPVKLALVACSPGKGKCETRSRENLTLHQVREGGGEFLPGAPRADPAPPAPPSEKRNPAGGTESCGAGLLAGPARLHPRLALGSARGRPSYLRVPTAQLQGAAALAATAAGPGSRAPGPLRPPPLLGVGGPTWAAEPAHISEGGGQRPTPLRAGHPSAPCDRRSRRARRSWWPSARGGGARCAPHPCPA